MGNPPSPMATPRKLAESAWRALSSAAAALRARMAREKADAELAAAAAHGDLGAAQLLLASGRCGGRARGRALCQAAALGNAEVASFIEAHARAVAEKRALGEAAKNPPPSKKPSRL